MYVYIFVYKWNEVGLMMTPPNFKFPALIWTHTIRLPAWRLNLDIKMLLRFHKGELLILSSKPAVPQPPHLCSFNSSLQLLGPKTLKYPWLLFFSHSTYPSYGQNLLALPSKCIQNLTSSHASIAVTWTTSIFCLNLMIRPSFWYAKRSGADFEGTAWRK